VQSPFADQPADKAEPALTVESLALPSYRIAASASVTPPPVSTRRKDEALLFDPRANKRQLLEPPGWLSAAELDLLAGNLVGEI
jgi:hypothetical protein